MKNFIYPVICVFIFLLPVCEGYSQLDTVHWIPPLHSRDNAQVQDHYLYLSTPIATPFTVTIRNGAGTVLATPTISNGNPFSYQIGNGQLAGSPSFVPIDSLNKVLKRSGLILSAPYKFYANLRARSTSQAECLTAKGRAGAGTEFRFGGFPQVAGDNLFGYNRNFTMGIMATANNTTVTVSGYNSAVVFADPVTPFSSPSLTFILNQGECYVVSGYSNVTANWDGFIGALIQSNQPIVINNGNVLGTIANNLNNQDMGFDQAVPTAKIGQEYILIEGLGSINMERPIVIAHYNNTDVFINGSATPVVTINAGQYYLVPNSFYTGTPHRNMYIYVSQPAYMYQALAGSTSDATGGLNFIPPVTCFLKDTIDLIPSVNQIGNAAYSGNIMAFTRQGATLQLNGITQTGAVAVTGAPWETYRITNITGNAKITSTNSVAAGIFGSSGAVGYAGYYAGFSEIPTLDAGNDTLLCAGQNVQLNAASSITGGTFFWSPSSGLSNPNIFNPVANPASTTSYTVTVTTPNGCTITDSIKISVVSSLTVTVSTQSVSCFGGNDGNASVSVIGGSGIYTYSWSTVPVQTTSSVSGLTAGTYTVVILDTSVVCGINTQIITIPEPPAITLTVSATAVSCNGGNDGTASVTVTGGSGSYTYLWSNGATTSQISNLLAGTYSVTITDVNGCTSASSVTVTQPQPVPVAVWGNTTICAGGSTTLAASGGVSYLWSTSATTSSVALTPVSTSTYSVMVTDANGCTNTASVTITVNPLPSAIITGNINICLGSSATLTAQGGINYIWNTTATSVSINVSPNTTTSYSVLVTDANGCSNVASTTVTVNPLPVAAVAGDSSICSGESVALVASGGVSYLWNTTATTFSVTVAPTSTSIFSVVVTDANGCSVSVSHTVLVSPLPNISVTGNLTVCQGDVITLTASGGTNYLWSNGVTVAFITTITSSTYSVIGTDANGCSSVAAATTTVLPPPVAAVAGDTMICQGEITVLTAGGGGNYLWNTTETTGSITVSSAGTYSVIVFIGSCSDTASITVAVNPLPNVNAGKDTVISLGENTMLNGNGNGNTYYWIPSMGLSCTNCLAPTASPTVTTSYTLIVTDVNGCTAQDEVTVFVEPPVCGELFIPNAFSPNNDGENDSWKIYYNLYCVEKLRVLIFNRWGEKIFESDNPAFEWKGSDGKGILKGVNENSGVFVYFLDMEKTNGEKISRKGNISLIR